MKYRIDKITKDRLIQMAEAVSVKDFKKMRVLIETLKWEDKLKFHLGKYEKVRRVIENEVKNEKLKHTLLLLKSVKEYRKLY